MDEEDAVTELWLMNGILINKAVATAELGSKLTVLTSTRFTILHIYSGTRKSNKLTEDELAIVSWDGWVP